MIIGKETPDLVEKNFKKSVVINKKKFRMANSNFVTKNVLLEVKKFVNRI